MRLEPGAGVVNGYAFFLESRSLSPTTVSQYLSHARIFVKWCAEQELDFKCCTRDHITMHLGELRQRAAQNTVRLRLLALRVFFDYCTAVKYRPDNPARDIVARRAQTAVIQPFTSTEIRKMYDACRTFREQAVFLLLLGGGLRRSEVFNVTKSDCNFEAGTVTVLGKGSQYRIIAPGQSVMDVLEKALAFDERLCPYETNLYVERLCKRLGKRAGIRERVHAHRWRHTFATSFLDAGGTIEELSVILGHSSISMSLFYARAGKVRRALQSQANLRIADRLLAG